MFDGGPSLWSTKLAMNPKIRATNTPIRIIHLHVPQSLPSLGSRSPEMERRHSCQWHRVLGVFADLVISWYVAEIDERELSRAALRQCAWNFQLVDSLMLYTRRITGRWLCISIRKSARRGTRQSMNGGKAPDPLRGRSAGYVTEKCM